MGVRMISIQLWAFAVLPAICGPVSEVPVSPVRHARILTLGESPPFRQEIRDGVRYELAPTPGSVPPREVIPAFGENRGERVEVRLGRISPAFPVPDGEGGLELWKAGGSPGEGPWLHIKRPASGDFLIIVWRSSAKGSWSRARGIVVPDGAAGAPAGSVRIANLFPLNVQVMWGAERLILRPGKSIRRVVKPGHEVSFQVLVARKSGGLKRYYSSAVTQNPGERGFVTIFRADGEAPRRPLRVSIFREPVRPAVPAGSEKRDEPDP